MSVLIKGMELPQNCYECPFEMVEFYDFEDHVKCELTGKLTGINKCPLVQIPPHGRLIDADALPDRYAEVRDLAPTIIDAEE